MSEKTVVGLVVVVGALVACFLVAGILRRRGVLSGEGSRKVAHVGMGATALSLPLLFENPWPLVGLATAIAFGLVAVRTIPALRQRIGFVVLDIDRPSYGELAFIVGVTLLFCFTQGNPIAFEAPVTVLMIADPLATIVGRRFGAHRFVVLGGFKSLEGSLAFFVAALACIVAVLLVAHHPLNVPAVAAVAVILTALEIGSPGGLDNLTIPLGGGWLLSAMQGWLTA